MTFNSLSYFLFLPFVFIVFYLVADRYRWCVLLISSFIFYGFLLNPVLLVVLAAIILITYLFGRLLHSAENTAKRKQLLSAGILINLSFLLYFKYLPFVVENLNLLLRLMHASLSLEVPQHLVSIALSFYIFQAISYLADIYFRMAQPEPHLGYFALYLSFFPKLMQGPIERANTLLPQLKAPYIFDYDTVRSGLLLFTLGLFKKVVLADRLALYADQVYNNVHDYSGPTLLVGTYIYALQIFFDFSGYTDMARGTGKLFGINLTENFNSPYFARSCTDFWKRWHISLSKWILDYIFEPLQMKFRNLNKIGTMSALLITFLVCGIWHGASWCYVIWGGIHGVYLATSFLYRPYQKKIHKRLGIDKSWWLKYWQMGVTFHLICFSFIFFRAKNLEDAWYVVKNILVF